MINDSNNKRYLAKYQVGSLVLMYEDQKIEMDASNILSIEYLTDYEFNLRAILKVVLRLDIRKKLWIIGHKREVKCKFEFNRIGMDIDTEKFITSPAGVWNAEFSVFLSDEDEAIDYKALEERIAATEGTASVGRIDTENYYENQNVVPLYLFHQPLLDASNKVFNEVFTENTIQQFMGRLLTATNHKKVLMSKCENDNVYKELLVPPFPAYKAITYLDQYYGLYKKGALIFYDIDTLYILNSAGDVVTAKRENEWTETTFFVSKVDNSTPGNGMVHRAGEKVYYVSLTEMDISVEKFTDTNNEYIGSEAKVIITDDVTINIQEADQTYISQRNETFTHAHKSDNPFNATIIKARMEENELIFYINGENFDITAFTPNKIFQLVFEEPIKQERFGKHKYRLVYAYHYFMIESEGYMSATSRICLKKCSEPLEG